jgi:streptomycin 3"-kinase
VRLTTELPGDGWIPVEVGESSARVYRRGQVFAKSCGPAETGDLAAERDRTEWLAGTGVPSATVLDWIEGPAGACLLTSAVPGAPGDQLPPASYERAMRNLGRTLRELHELPDCPFERPLADVVATAENVVLRDAVNPAFLTDEWRQLKPSELLDQVLAERPYVEEVLEPAVCHGDACLPNVIFDPRTLEVTGLIDLGRLGIADRYADLALIAVQLHDEWSVDAAPLFEAYGVPDPDQRRLSFFRLLDPLTWPTT